MVHPLKILSLAALFGLLFCQLGLYFWPGYSFNHYWIILLSLPLLTPIKGMIANRLYTYKWVGFLTLLYFCIGVSELVSNPALRIYAILTTGFSLMLFLSGIYYTRYLRLNRNH